MGGLPKLDPAISAQSNEPGDSDTRSRILTVARALFVVRGYESTGVAEIARQAGITPGALYWHFKSKEEILATVLEEGLAEFDASISTSLTGDSPSVRLYQLVRAHVLFQLSGFGANDVLATNFVIAQLAERLSASAKQRVNRHLRAHLNLVEEIIQEGLDANEFEVHQLSITALAVINLAEYTVTWFRTDGPLQPAEVAHIYGLLALGMVGAKAYSAIDHLGESGALTEVQAMPIEDPTTDANKRVT